MKNRIIVRLPDEMYAQLVQQSEELELQLSSMIRLIIAYWFEEQKWSDSPDTAVTPRNEVSS